MATKKPDINARLPLTDMAFHVLLALGDGASHGYAIGKSIERQSDGRLRPTTGSLYQVLRRLHDDALIAESKPPANSESRDSRRQYFRLTPFGKRVFGHEAARLEALIAAAREKNLIQKSS